MPNLPTSQLTGEHVIRYAAVAHLEHNQANAHHYPRFAWVCACGAQTLSQPGGWVALFASFARHVGCNAGEHKTEKQNHNAVTITEAKS